MHRLPAMFALLLLPGMVINAQWEINGMPVCDTAGNQWASQKSILPDGEGGAYIFWQDSRAGWDIYAQHIDSAANLSWESQGKPIVQTSGNQWAVWVVSDGEGGFVMTWHDSRNDGTRDVYAQRVNHDGESLWEENGIPVAVETKDQAVFGLTRTSDNGFIATWSDERFGYDSVKVYAQKLNLEGRALWEEHGVVVSNTTGIPQPISDLQGGCIVVWSTLDGDDQLRAQRMDSHGNRLWGEDGVVASTDFGNWSDTEVTQCSDSTGGVIIAWDYREPFDAYIQRLDSSGNRLWGDTGIRLGTDEFAQFGPKVQMLEQDTILCMWLDSGLRLHMQKFDLEGNAYFEWQGRRVNNYIVSLEYSFAIDADKNIVVADKKSVSDLPPLATLHSHKVSSNGHVFWDSSGVAVINFDMDRGYDLNPSVVSDEAGGALVIWQDWRAGSPNSLYAQRIYADGRVGGDTSTVDIGLPGRTHSPDRVELEGIYPNPFNSQTRIAFRLNHREQLNVVIYNLSGQRIRVLAKKTFQPGFHELVWNATNERDITVSSGIYLAVFEWQQQRSASKIILLK